MVNQSILGSMKQMLYGSGAVLADSYDQELVVLINGYLAILRQLGVGPAEGLYITGEDETWSQLTDNQQDVAMAKSYIYMKLRIDFDPPDNASVLSAYKENVKEIEWRAEVGA